MGGGCDDFGQACTRTDGGHVLLFTCSNAEIKMWSLTKLSEKYASYQLYLFNIMDYHVPVH